MKRVSLFSGIYQDIRARLPYYKSDWIDGLNYRVIPATIYIYFANILPAIAFAQDMFDRTQSAYGVNEVLLASSMGGIIFGIFSGQPLCIVGVTGPISVFNYTVFELIVPRGTPYFPFMAWICIWAFIMHSVIAITEGVLLMKYVTLFSCDIFGFFINVIYLQKGIEILIRQLSTITEPTAANYGGAYFSIVIAMCIFVFGFGSLIVANKTPFFPHYMRTFIADYSLPLCVIFFTGFSFFPGRISQLEIQRLDTGIAYQPTTNQFGRNAGWFIHFWEISVGDVFLALPFGLLLTALFYFDHNISSIMCQGPSYRFRKPASFHWDFFLLGITTLVSGLLGIPAPNGLIPQAPLHTSCLADKTPDYIKEANMDTAAATGKNKSECQLDDEDEDEDESKISKNYSFVLEQRVTNTAQGLLTLGTMSGPLLVVLHLVPQGVLAGLFWMMSTALLDNEITRRIGLLITEPALRDPTDKLNHIERKWLYIFVAISLIGAAAEVAITETKGAIGFPAVLLLFMFIGAMLPRFIPEEALKYLDGPAASEFILSTLDPRVRKAMTPSSTI